MDNLLQFVEMTSNHSAQQLYDTTFSLPVSAYLINDGGLYAASLFGLLLEFRKCTITEMAL
jgi:hypothetical protein